LKSYFGRVQYNYNETYLFNATFRADGSSKFAEGKRWGYFPSFSFGWVLSQEDFISSVSALSFLKLRGSWGQNGNQNIDAFQYLAPIKFIQAQYAFGSTEGQSTLISYPNRLSNEDLKWETSEQWNFRFDSRFMKGKLSVIADWYRKSTKDWLIKAPILATAGTGAPFINGENVINTGIELSVEFANYEGDFTYEINANGTYNQNEVQEIPTDVVLSMLHQTLYIIIPLSSIVLKQDILLVISGVLW